MDDFNNPLKLYNVNKDTNGLKTPTGTIKPCLPFNRGKLAGGDIAGGTGNGFSYSNRRFWHLNQDG